MSTSPTNNIGTTTLTRETSNLDELYRDNMNTPVLDIASAQKFAELSGVVNVKAACAVGMTKLIISCCKDIMRIVGT
ncbi:hypothetical protein [Bordetella bronchialis]|uniref:Uncharacterized protein n=1 Tax=Bordetella bronchialis TaxID=463025 RepID=A0A193FKM2_9BORD|nr:hypothetical protein [Bordetella bronchialis]ANN68307.1 hypothetical protein BAU06_20175 [Bordetella bronchialis]ANN73447.1 hypothetical protein BAU08_20705 [Bordetella bronchialis]